MKKEANNAAAGLFIPAGLMIGFGIGFILEDIAPSMFIGLGIGFAITAIILLKRRK